MKLISAKYTLVYLGILVISLSSATDYNVHITEKIGTSDGSGDLDLTDNSISNNTNVIIAQPFELNPSVSNGSKEKVVAQQTTTTTTPQTTASTANQNQQTADNKNTNEDNSGYSVVWILAGLLMFGGLVTIFYFRNYYKREKISSSVPGDIINDYQYCERRYNESNGKINPNTILWDLAKSKRDGQPNYSRASGTEDREPRNESRELPIQNAERNSVQVNNSSTAPIHKQWNNYQQPGVEKLKGNNNKTFLSRIRERRK